MNPLLLDSATGLARRIRIGEVSSLTVVRTHIDRIRVVNPVLNAVVAERFEAALDEARAADRRLRDEGAEGLPPFHGVPCTIKEAFALTGMPHTSGLVAREGVTAAQDATGVARLRAAGAIPLGVTNVSELCMWMESHNHVYGRTRNPYDPRRTVGGSSGGEGSVVGAGGSPFGLGADIGGSIRMPAFFCGVFGHKPTGGLVPSTGQFPNGESAALRRILTTGPIARRAEDLHPLLRILAGPDGHDPGCREAPLGDPAAVRLDELTVLDVPDNGVTPVHPELRAAQERVVRYLADRGARVRRARIPALRASLPIWASMLSAADDTSYRELLGQGERIHIGRELLRSLWGRSPYTIPSLGLALLEQIPERLPTGAGKMIARGRALRQELVERIGPEGVMLYPSYASPAPRHWAPLFPPTRWAYTAILNAMELPSTQVPLGLGKQGLPLGVQVVGIHHHDHLTLAVAQALEQGFGGWVPPLR